MRWVNWILLIILFSSSCLGLSVQTMTHTSTSSEVIMVVATPSDSLSIVNINHTFYSSTLIFKIAIPSSQLSVADMNHTSQSSDIIIKVSKPLSKLRVENMTHTAYSNIIIVNISDYNITRLVSNTSKFFTNFIKSINTSLPIIVGKNSYDEYLLDKYDSGIQNGFVKYYDKIGVYPFNSLVISATINGNRTIFIYGNAIEGEIAGLRYLKKHKDEFIYMDNKYYINDIDALSVYDYLHTNDTQKYYNKDTKEFAYYVNKSLFGKVEERIIDVKTNEGVLLRVLEVEPKNSQKMINYRQNITMPLVFARGLWSDLYAWQNFGIEMADEGRKVYLIEITGGPGQDCDTCLNYNFNDLSNSYFPAMIATIQALNNNSQIQYVGFSNGCRTALSSLELYQKTGKLNAGQYFNGNNWINVDLNNNSVKTFVGVACPGAFSELSFFAKQVNESGNIAISNLLNQNKNHITFTDVGRELDSKIANAISFVMKIFEDDGRISANLFNDYYLSMMNQTDKQLGNFEVEQFTIIAGNYSNNNDLIVPLKDEEEIYANINATNKSYYILAESHLKIPDRKTTQQIIRININGYPLESMYLIRKD